MLPELFRVPLLFPSLDLKGIGLVVAVLIGYSLVVDRWKRPILVVAAALITYVIGHRILELPVVWVPINSYGALIMMGFLAATFIAIKRLKTLPWKLDMARPGNLRLIADELVRTEKIKPERIPEADPIDLAALGASETAVGEATQGVVHRKNSDFILDLAIISMIFGLIGGKIIYVLQYPDQIGETLKILNIADGKLHPLGALLGALPIYLFFVITRRRRISVRGVKKTFAIMTLTTLFFALAGTRAYYIYQNPSEFNLGTFRSWQSGFVLYGGLILGFLSGVGYAMWRKRPILLTADIVSPNILLGVAFGRVGCFLNGCCFGKTADDFFCSVSYPRDTMPYNHQVSKEGLSHTAEKSLGVHPVQLYEAVALVAMFFVLSRLWKKNPKPGVVFALSGLGYAVWRFLIEFMRADERPDAFWGLSFSQGVSLGLMAFFSVLLAVFLKRLPKPVDLVA